MPRSILLVGLAVAVVACGSKSPTGNNNPPAKILIVGHDMGPQYEHFDISMTGADPGNAQVTLNGTTLPTTADGRYDYTFPSELPVGSDLDLVVKLGVAMASAHQVVLARPVLTSPANNATIPSDGDIDVTWTATDNPDSWSVWLQWKLNGSYGKIVDTLPPSARATSFHASAVPAGATEIAVIVYGYGHGNFSGDADPASNMNVRFSSSPANLTIGAAPILITGISMGDRYQSFDISQPGADLSTAVITLNGTPVTSTADGHYFFALPSSIPVGGSLDLVVELGGATASGHQAIVAPPVITAPANNSIIVADGDIAVTWTDSHNPAYWEVDLRWRNQHGVIVAKSDSLPASARAATLHATDLPVGATDVSVVLNGYEHGSFSGDIDPASDMRVKFPSEPANLTIGSGGLQPILIRGFDMSTQFENFSISRPGSDVSQAVVSINGTTIPTSATGSYNYNIGHTLAPGTDLVLRVELDGDVVTATATIPDLPTITTPVTNQVVTIGQPLNFAWTAATDPDWWLINIGFASGGSGRSISDSLTTIARSGSLSTNSIPAGATDLKASVFGYLKGTFTGPADPASNMKVRIEPTPVDLVLGP